MVAKRGRVWTQEEKDALSAKLKGKTRKTKSIDDRQQFESIIFKLLPKAKKIAGKILDLDDTIEVKPIAMRLAQWVLDEYSKIMDRRGVGKGRNDDEVDPALLAQILKAQKIMNESSSRFNSHNNSRFNVDPN